ncbi:hypothetical protein [Nocardioides sp. GY 10127]|uniref:hypothetical protein n=1 Tax=Nocardioides sp. GY 10127 TaxID=2569762 RepID=UPI0010A83E40|nr:hypothetical protein [Nocardioides sp. GY 10127]TIC81708.1 hypothetical protein E8D37_10965 [Nocardioides sp. GY 10127]
MVSAIGRLLDELSWEGNARKYRGGGVGLENVLTTEVFQALDLLPRTAFLGRVLGAASPVSAGATAAIAEAVEQIEGADVDVLAGDATAADDRVKVQPDALIESSSSYVLVEAKRARGGSFQPEQLARELLVASHQGAGRVPLLLLVLGEEPPIMVKGHGRLSIEDAVRVGQESIEARLGISCAAVLEDASIAHLTWERIARETGAAADGLAAGDPSLAAAVRRLAGTVIDAVSLHR